MLSTVITLFETVKTIGYYSIFVSYNTGKIIVNGLIACFEVLSKLLYTLWTVLVILEEDLLVFLSDVLNKIILVLQGIHHSVEYFGESIIALLSFIKYVILGTFDAIVTFFQTIFTIITKVIFNIGAVIAGIKHLVVLFGSGVWFVITLVPIFIVYVCMITTYYIGRAFEELKTLLSQIATGIQDIFTFVTDVPLEALAGLIVCCCLIYAIVVFHIALYSKLRRFARYILTILNHNFIRIKTALFRRRNNRRAQTENESSSSGSEMSEDELVPIEQMQVSSNEGWRTKKQRNKQLMEEDNRLCVICMERNKCILAMPCRHLCTCSECNNTLRNYQRTCPICRRYVNYTIHVY